LESILIKQMGSQMQVGYKDDKYMFHFFNLHIELYLFFSAIINMKLLNLIEHKKTFTCSNKL